MNSNNENRHIGRLYPKEKLIAAQSTAITPMAIAAVSSDTEGDVAPLKNCPDAPFSYSFSDSESVPMASGTFQLTATDFTLPGKNGLDLVITRRYDSDQAATRNLTVAGVTTGRKSYYYIIYVQVVAKKNGVEIEKYDYPLWAEYGFADSSERTSARKYEWDYYKYDYPNTIDMGDGVRATETLEYEEGNNGYILHETEIEDNSHFVNAYGLGYGWSFAFPSIEMITELKDDGLHVENKPYLHLADGRTFKLKDNPTSTTGSNLVDYSLGDVRIQRIGTNYYVVSYKNGQKDYLSNGTIVKREDRFGNAIHFEFKGEKGAKITDSLGRVITLTPTAVSGGYTLTWNLPDGSKITYNVTSSKRLTKVTDQENRPTSYEYSLNNTYHQLYKDISGDGGGIIPHLNLNKITHPTGLVTTYGYKTETQMEKYHEAQMLGEWFTEYDYGRQRQYNVLNWRQDSYNGQVSNRQDYEFTTGYYEKKKRKVYLHYRPKATLTETKGGVSIVRTYNFDGKSMLQTMTEKHGGYVMLEEAYRYDNDTNKQRTQAITRQYNSQTTGTRPVIVTQRNWTYDARGNVETEKFPVSATDTTTVTTKYDASYNLPLYKEYDRAEGVKIREEYTLRSDQKVVQWKKISEKAGSGAFVLKEAAQYHYENDNDLTSSTKNNNLVRERRYANLNLSNSDNDRVTEYSYANTNPALGSANYNGAFLTQIKVTGVKDIAGGSAPSAKGAGIARTDYIRDHFGRIIHESDPEGNITKTTYDGLGRVTKVEYPDNNKAETVYDDSANIITVTDENARKTKYKYTALGKLESVTALAPETLLTYNTYDALNRLSKETTYGAQGNTIATYTYDSFDRVLSKTITGPELPSSYQETYSYDDAFDTAKKYTKESKTIVGAETAPSITSFVLKDVLGRVREETTGDSTVKSEYDYLGNKLSQTDPRDGVVTASWTYDYAGRVLSETRKQDSGSVTAYTAYDNLGNKAQFTDFRNKTTTFRYDVPGRLLEQSAAFSGTTKAVTHYAYNAAGHVTSQKVLTSDSKWRVTGYIYDKRYRVTDTIMHDGKTEIRARYEYDGVGNKTVMYTGMLGNSVSGAARTTYTYDRFGNMLTMTDPIGNSANPSEPLKRTETYKYDKYGKLESKKDRNGNTTTYSLDGLGRVRNESVQDADNGVAAISKAFTYHKNGLKATEENGELTVTFAYDNMGRLVSQTEKCRQGAANTIVKAYSYNKCGNRISFTMSKDGVQQISMSYDYDRQNRLKEVLKSGVKIAAYTYDQNGNRASMTYPQSGIAASYVYNDANLVTDLYNKKGTAHRSSYHYSYSPDGNQTKKTAKVSGKSDVVTDYKYDLLGRLTQEKVTGGDNILYEYDRFGNRSKMTVTDKNGKITTTNYIYDLRSRLQTETKKYGETEEILTYLYDYNGNQVHRQWEKFGPKKDKPVPGKAGFYSDKFKEDIAVLEMREYNGFDELTYLYRDTVETRYAYRPDGLRLKKVFADGSETGHIWDGAEICAEYGKNGAIHSRYLRGVNLIAREQGSALQYYQFNAHALDTETPQTEIMVSAGQNQVADTQQTGAPSLVYYQFNGHGDVESLTDASGNIIKSYDYDAFGVEKNIDPNDTNVFRYCGEMFDKETGTYYLRNRSYAPRTGRFTSEDPARSGLNWYTYCGGNPIMWIDPLGLAPTAKEAALMAEHIYEATKDNYHKDIGGGWMLIEIKRSKMGESWSNLKIGVYSRTIDGVTEYALVNKGTTPSSGDDWLNNLGGPTGFSSDTWESIGYAKFYDEKYKDQELTMIGHSKGAAEAIANAVATDRDAITFNPMKPNLGAYGLDGSNYTGTMTHYVVRGDILNNTFGEPSVGQTVYLAQQFKTPWFLKYSIFGGPINPIKNHSMQAVINALTQEGYN